MGYCSVCKQTISDKVYEYSMNHFGRPLCINHQKANNPEVMLCTFCKRKISKKVYDYSTRHFGRALCWEHQKNAKPNKPTSSKIITRPQILRHCSDCNRAITLCRKCQPYTERRKKYRTSSAPPKRKLTKPSPIELGGKTPKDKKYYSGY